MATSLHTAARRADGPGVGLQVLAPAQATDAPAPRRPHRARASWPAPASHRRRSPTALRRRGRTGARWPPTDRLRRGGSSPTPVKLTTATVLVQLQPIADHGAHRDARAGPTPDRGHLRAVAWLAGFGVRRELADATTAAAAPAAGVRHHAVRAPSGPMGPCRCHRCRRATRADRRPAPDAPPRASRPAGSPTTPRNRSSRREPAAAADPRTHRSTRTRTRIPTRPATRTRTPQPGAARRQRRAATFREVAGGAPGAVQPGPRRQAVRRRCARSGARRSPRRSPGPRRWRRTPPGWRSFVDRRGAAVPPRTDAAPDVARRRVSPRFPQPMVEPLTEVAQRAGAPRARAGAAQHRRAAGDQHHRSSRRYLVGLNTEMGRELLWREYPRRPAGDVLRPLLGRLVLTRRAPDIAGPRRRGATVRSGPARRADERLRAAGAQRAAAPLPGRDRLRDQGRTAREAIPIFTGGFAPDVRFFGFDIDAADDRRLEHRHPGAARRRRASASRSTTDTGTVHATCRSPTATATPPPRRAGLRQLPVRITIPATVLLRSSSDGDQGRRTSGHRSTTAVDGPPELGRRRSTRRTIRWRCFPVRLETRFFARARHTELRVRVYPGQGPPRLARPGADGRRAARGAAATGSCSGRPAADDGERLRDAWRMLADRLRPRRAAWIARGADTDQPRRSPATPVAATPTWRRHRSSPTSASRRRSTRTPLVRLLPDRWVATAYAGGPWWRSATGRDIAADLADRT